MYTLTHVFLSDVLTSCQAHAHMHMAAAEPDEPSDPTLKKVTVFMPGVTTKIEDEYVQTSTALPKSEMYIRRFTPKFDETKAHHLLLFLCENLPVSALTSSSGSWRDGETCGQGVEAPSLSELRGASASCCICRCACRCVR